MVFLLPFPGVSANAALGVQALGSCLTDVLSMADGCCQEQCAAVGVHCWELGDTAWFTDNAGTRVATESKQLLAGWSLGGLCRSKGQEGGQAGGKRGGHALN